MFKFARLTHGGHPISVSSNLLTQVSPRADGLGATLHFSGEETVAVEESLDEIVAQLGGWRTC